MFFKIKDGRGCLYQWDTGVFVECDESLGELEQVHFATGQDENAIVVETHRDDDGKLCAAIPNELLQRGVAITAYAYVPTDDGGFTKKAQRLAVIERPKPDDYVYTETEAMTWKSLDERLTEVENEPASLPGLTGAKVGQFAQILEVDENGEPSKWKAVDLESGNADSDKSLVTAYDAGVVRPFLRYDTFWDVVNPMFVTKHLNECATNNSVEIINDGSTVHEVSGVLGGGGYLYITYLKNIDGTTGDTGDTSESGRTKVYFTAAYSKYGYGFKPTMCGTVELFAKGQELADGTTINTGGPSCPMLYSNGTTLFAVCIFEGKGCGGYVRTADISESPAPEDVVWSKAQPWTLSIDGESGKFDMNRLNGWTKATWQTNNQIIWESSVNLFMTAVCVNGKAVVLLKSANGVDWTYRNTIYTDYLCKFQCEAAIFRNANSNIWIAVRNGNTTLSTDKLCCGNKNYLTVFKVSSAGVKLEEYNIPDVGTKPYFIPVPPSTKKAAYLLHNAQSRYSVQIEYVGEWYPGMTLGEMYGVGTNYCMGVNTHLSTLTTKPIVFMGTTGLVTEKKGASLVYGANLGQFLDSATSLSKLQDLG